MDKEEGFVINLDDIPVEDIEGKKEKEVEVKPPEKEVEKPAKKDEKVILLEEEDNLITVDVAPSEKKEAEKEKEEEEKKAAEAEEEKEKDTEDKSKDGEDTDDSQETESPSFLHATALRDKGVLPNLDLEALKEKSDEEIIKATILGTQDEIERTVKDIVEQQDKVYQQFVEVLNSGGDLEAYAKIKASQSQFEGITAESLEDDEELQKTLLTEDMKERGFSNDDIVETIEELAEKEGKLLSKAKPALTRLKKREKDREATFVKKTEDDKKEQDDKRTATLKKVDETLNGIKEIIPGIPLAAREREVVRKLMTVPVEYQDGIPVSRAQQLRAEDPVAWETLLNYYVAIGLFDKTPSWEKVLKRATTDATKKIMKSLKDGPRYKPGRTLAKEPEDDGVIVIPDNI